MEAIIQTKQNLKQAVPFFMIVDMPSSLKFYVDGLAFNMKNKWTPRDRIEWCLLERDGVAVMLQEYRKDIPDTRTIEEKRGEGISIWFQCEDALQLYHEFLSKGLTPAEPFVGNGMWDVKLIDPDGYHLHFESVTDVPEETTYSDWQNNLK